MRPNTGRPIMPKRLLIITDLSSISCYFETTSLTSFMKVSAERSLQEGYSIEKCQFCFFGRNPDIAKNAYDWDSSLFKFLFFPDYYRLDFFHQGLNHQLFTCRRLWQKESAIFSVGILIIRKCQKVLIILTYLDIQVHISWRLPASTILRRSQSTVFTVGGLSGNSSFIDSVTKAKRSLCRHLHW